MDIKKLFRNVDFTMFIKNTVDVYDNTDRFVGATLSLPFALRKGMKPYRISLSGVRSWENSLQIRYVRKGEIGQLSSSVAIIPEPIRTIDGYIFNRDRLSPNYIKKNKYILLEAYNKYVYDILSK